MIEVMISGAIRDVTHFPAVPRVGEYIEWGPERFFRVMSVHYQGNYDGVMIVVEDVARKAYDMVRGEQ